MRPGCIFVGVNGMKRKIRWTAWNGLGLEHCVYEEEGGAIRLSGAVVGRRGSEYGAFYSLQTDTDLCTREVKVDYAGGVGLHVLSDADGQWYDRLSGDLLDELTGCLDIDIGVTPATNMLPIRRLQLQEGEAREIVVAYVPLPVEIDTGFTPRPAQQRYTCLKRDRLYRYEGLFRGYSAELEVDEQGLVLDYPDTFRRVVDAVA